MATLEWATLVVCCAVLLLRLPDAVKGRNRTVFGILLLATLCSMLAVSELYEAIDAGLGGRHVASLILRYLVFATVLLVGLRVTRGLAATGGYALIGGVPGRWALALRCLPVTVTFLMTDSTGVPEGLRTVPGPANGTPSWPPYYTAVLRADLEHIR